VRLRLPKPTHCPNCNESKPLQLSNKDHKYRRILEDWQYLCRKCHSRYDALVNSWNVAENNPFFGRRHTEESKILMRNARIAWWAA
jgi:hypothetical protein